MDLNQLLYHHQIALMAVNRAQRDGRPLPNFDLPRYYAKRISEYRDNRGLSGALVIPPEPTMLSFRPDAKATGGPANDA